MSNGDWFMGLITSNDLLHYERETGKEGKMELWVQGRVNNMTSSSAVMAGSRDLGGGDEGVWGDCKKWGKTYVLNIE